jgi:hypothetical protein
MLGQKLEPGQVQMYGSSCRNVESRWLLLDFQQMKQAFNRRPFPVKHRLDENPHFSIESLRQLCKRMPRSAVKHRVGKIPIDAHFDTSLGRYKGGMEFEDAVDRTVETGGYIAIFNPEKDAEYRPIIEGLLGEIAALTEQVEPGMNWYSTYIFISAQDSVTPYHMDREMNFLLQIRGEKTVQLFDGYDDAVMSPAERDRMLAGFDRPVYHKGLVDKAMTFDLRPGMGVHHPFIAPHIVHTKSDLSISLAITFRTPRSDLLSDAHTFNQRMHGLGFEPRPVGKAHRLDSLKAMTVRWMRNAKRLLKPAFRLQPKNQAST